MPNPGHAQRANSSATISRVFELEPALLRLDSISSAHWSGRHAGDELSGPYMRFGVGLRTIGRIALEPGYPVLRTDWRICHDTCGNLSRAREVGSGWHVFTACEGGTRFSPVLMPSTFATRNFARPDRIALYDVDAKLQRLRPPAADRRFVK